MAAKIGLVVLVFTVACGSDGGPAPGGPLSTTGKFATVIELTANPQVKAAITALPAGQFVAAGRYHEGDTPADISGKWSSACCGGLAGRWPQGNNFATDITYTVTGPGRVDVPAFSAQIDMGDGLGSFVVGTGERVTVFLQLAIRCRADGENVRAVAVDRFIHSSMRLTEYIRSYVVLARDKPGPEWNCFNDAVGTGSTSTAAEFARLP